MSKEFVEDSANRYGGYADDDSSTHKTAYFRGYSPEHDIDDPRNPDGTPMYDGTAYYLLEDGTTLADAYWCKANGYSLSDAPSPKVVAPALGGQESALPWNV